LAYLAWRWDPDRPWPVVVHVRHSVRDLLNVVDAAVRSVCHDDVVGWRHSALSHVLTDQEEVLHNTQSHSSCSECVHPHWLEDMLEVIGAIHQLHRK